MKIKTSELEGIALDWAVAQCEGVKTYGAMDFRIQRREVVLDGEYVYRWSDSWMQGGPILDREQFSLDPIYIDGQFRAWVAFGHNLKYDIATGEYIDGSDHRQYGHTPLIAAMRCYVASKLGDEVEIPEGLA